MNRVRLMAVASAVLLLPSCLGGSDAAGLKAPRGGVIVRFEGGAVAAEVAADTPERQLGLMNRKELAPDAGMLFLFAERRRHAFWMKNTLIPLSIAFLTRKGDRTFKVIAVRDMVPCREAPCPYYYPDRDYDAALEVNRGWFARHELGRGSVGEVDGKLPDPTLTRPTASPTGRT